MAEGEPTVIKKKKVAGGGHHGGAWKIAYADFVTAMMAFFLLMWLINATSQEQKLGIANYFNPSGSVSTAGGSTGVLEGAAPLTLQGSADSLDEGSPASDMELEEAEAVVAEHEAEQFAEIEAELTAQIAGLPELKHLAENLIIDQTPEGLRIQLTDRDDQRSMFERGRVTPLPHTRELLALIARAIAGVPNRISVRGHTDAAPYLDGRDYDNWDLSAARANAARRVLEEAGTTAARFASVVGQAEREPLIEDAPLDARNRRISIILLRARQAGPAEATADFDP
jgi:chemotaxis protein MotB